MQNIKTMPNEKPQKYIYIYIYNKINFQRKNSFHKLSLNYENVHSSFITFNYLKHRKQQQNYSSKIEKKKKNFNP